MRNSSVPNYYLNIIVFCLVGLLLNLGNLVYLVNVEILWKFTRIKAWVTFSLSRPNGDQARPDARLKNSVVATPGQLMNLKITAKVTIEVSCEF